MVIALAPNVEVIPGYVLVKYLGRGGFGEVWEAIAPGGLNKAIKIAPMEQGENALNCRELDGLQKMRSIRHPYLLTIERFEVISGYLVIVMELADKNMLNRYEECVAEGKRGIPRDELLRYMREASEVLDLLNNEYGLQHLDVKPENLFLCSGHVKVADFGLVQPRNSNMSLSAVAISPPYAAPELFDGRVEPTADLYSLGVTYQELLTGTRPYKGTDVRSLILQHVKSKPELGDLPASDRLVVQQAINRDVTQRFANCTEFVEALIESSRKGPHHMAGPRMVQSQTGPQPTNLTPKTVDKTTESNNGQSAELTAAREEEAQLKEMIRSGNQLQSTFVAFLPLEIFGRKLKGFIDAMHAEVAGCSDENTLLYFGTRGWFGKPKDGIFMDIGTCCPNPHSGHRVVDIVIRRVGSKVTSSELMRRGMLLIRFLKSHLMVSDIGSDAVVKTEAAMRREIFG